MNVAEVWKLYEPVSRRDNDTWQTERSRAAHLVRLLGSRRVAQLSLADVDEYREARLRERTVRGAPPAPATLDREVELLVRAINYAVACRKVYANPLAKVKLLGKPNVRRSVIDEKTFAALVEAAPEHIRPILTVAYDTGMRLGEILGLRWDQVNLPEGCLELEAEATKTEEPRRVFLTSRVLSKLGELAGARPPDTFHVFLNPATGDRYWDIRKAFGAAARAVGRPNLWFHDLRRSFVTRARRRGIPQSVVKRMSGHKTDSVFVRYNIVEDRDVQDAARKLEE